MKINIQEMVKKNIRELKAYKPEEILCPIRMEANENPFTINSSLKERVLESISRISLNRYPDSLATDLRKQISAKSGIKPESIIVGNGSDELIQMLITAFCENEDKVLFPVPTFSMFGIIAKSFGVNTIEIPLASEWDIDLAEIKKSYEKNLPKIIFLSTPNNPTGNCFSENKILDIIEKTYSLVVVDEAYADFCGKTFIDQLKHSKNLIILKTLSKVGMAGLRVGYLIASKEIINILHKIRLPYNSNSLSQAAAKVILTNNEIVESQVQQIIKGREFLLEELKKLQDKEGITLFHSNANFILFKTEKDADIIHRKLTEEGVLIRNLNSEGPLKNCLRVTVGRPEENDAFIKALKIATK
jgi:histidinol-phosphate aminotransferase